MRYLNHTRISLLTRTVLILLCFACLYLVSFQTTEHGVEESVLVREVFAITEADRYVGTEDSVEVFFDQTEGDFTIDMGGSYLLSGDLRGTLYIDAEDQHVHLLLNNLSITGSNGPAISGSRYHAM